MLTMAEIDIQARLKSAMAERGERPKPLALRAGLNENAVNNILKRPNASPQLSTLAALAGALNMTVGELIGERAPAGEGFRMIGAYNITASAGPGAVLVEAAESTPMYQLAFRDQWLAQITNAGDEDLAVLFADGDSMEPTLRDGDTMLIDRTQINIRRPGIYVIGFEGTLNVKRVSVNELAGTIRISSDNPAYAAYDATPDDQFQVAGRVIWIGRKV